MALRTRRPDGCEVTDPTRPDAIGRVWERARADERRRLLLAGRARQVR